jgi:acetoacetyl-CoA synthetase
LWKWSVTHIADFWYEVFHFLHIRSQNPPTCPADVVDENARMFPRPTWFGSTSVNFAENLLYPYPEIENPDTTIVIIEASEAGVQQRVTWTELRERVAQFAAALRSAGITKGDRVGGIVRIEQSNYRYPGKHIAFCRCISRYCVHWSIMVVYLT